MGRVLEAVGAASGIMRALQQHYTTVIGGAGRQAAFVHTNTLRLLTHTHSLKSTAECQTVRIARCCEVKH